jgi:uncharacterized protein (DUF697 family)
MPTIGTAVGFWRTVSEVSPRVINEEVSRGFVLGLVGTPDDAAWVQETLLTAHATEAQRAEASVHIRVLAAPPTEDAAAAYAFVLYLAGADEPIGVRGEKSAPFAGTLDEVLEWMLRAQPRLTLALARRFPYVRPIAGRKLIRDAARINAQIAFFSTLPGLVPGWLLPLLPITGVADVLLLTKNQAMLVMRLAAVHGHKPGYTRQVKELMTIIGSALGWRTVAREVIGAIPGVGVAIKPAIAYSGTTAAGRAALWFYQRGIKPTVAQVKALEKESEAEAAEAVKELLTAPPDEAETVGAEPESLNPDR